MNSRQFGHRFNAGKAVKVRHLVLIGFIVSLGLCESSYSNEKTILVGATKIIIPSPVGFHPASKRFPETGRLMETYTAPDSRLIEGYVSEGDIGNLLSGSSPDYERYMFIETMEKASQFHMSKSMFDDLSNKIKTKQDNLYEGVKYTVESLLENASDKISLEFDILFEIHVLDVIPLGVFLETSDAVAFASLAKVGAQIDLTQSEQVSIGAVSLIYIKGKILYASVFATFNDTSDIAWVRKTTTEWVEAIVASNPTTLISPPSNSSQNNSTDSGSTEIIGKVLGLLIVGLLVGLARKLFAKKAATENSTDT